MLDKTGLRQSTGVFAALSSNASRHLIAAPSNVRDGAGFLAENCPANLAMGLARPPGLLNQGLGRRLDYDAINSNTARDDGVPDGDFRLANARMSNRDVTQFAVHLINELAAAGGRFAGAQA